MFNQLFSGDKPQNPPVTGDIATGVVAITLGSTTYNLPLSSKVSEGTWNPGSPFSINQLLYQIPLTTEAAIALPGLQIKYRPEVDGSRHELIMERPDATGPDLADLPAYSVELIDDAGTVLLSGSTPEHYLYARWPLRTAKRPIVRTAADLSSAGLTFEHQSTNTITRTWADVPYTPMGTAWVNRFFGTTGGRDDIGILPEPTAYYLAKGTTDSRDAMMEAADASASVGWFARDETGQLFNMDTHPNMARVDLFGSTVWARSLTDHGAEVPNYDIAHMPSLCYVPYLLTGDLYYLEQLQAQINTVMLTGQPDNGCQRIATQGGLQVRSYAWAIRDLYYACLATPDGSLPATLLPREYFLRKLENERQWLLNMGVNSLDPTVQRFGLIVSDPQFRGQSGFMRTFISQTLLGLVRAGFTGWSDVQPFDKVWLLGVCGGPDGDNGWTDAAYYHGAFCGADRVGCADWAAAYATNTITIPSDNATPTGPTSWGEAETLGVWNSDHTAINVDGNYATTFSLVLECYVDSGHTDLSAALTRNQMTTDRAAKENYVNSACSPATIPSSSGDAQFIAGQLDVVGTHLWNGYDDYYEFNLVDSDSLFNMQFIYYGSLYDTDNNPIQASWQDSTTIKLGNAIVHGTAGQVRTADGRYLNMATKVWT